MKNKLKTILTLSSLMLAASPASAYVYSITNGTPEPIAVDLYGIAVFGGSMFQGKMPDWGINPYRVSHFGKTTHVKNAGHANGPQKIGPGETAEYDFNSLDFGICLDLANLKVGLQSQGFSMIARDVVNLPSEYYDALFGSIAEFGTDIGKMSEAAKVAGAKGQAIAAAGEGLGKLIGTIGNLVRHSTCKQVSFIVIKDENKAVKVTTKGL